MAAGHGVRTGVPRRRRVAATDVVTRQAATQMHPAPTDGEAIAADCLEVVGHRGQRNGLEMRAASHTRLLSSGQSSVRAASAWYINRVARRLLGSGPCQARLPAAAQPGRSEQGDDLAR